MNDTQRKWLLAAQVFGGSFIATFARSCFYADDENFSLLESVLDQMIVKYPHYLSPRYQEKVGD